MAEEGFTLRMIFKTFAAIHFLLAVLYGQDSIIFSHNYHIDEEELECSVCHEDVFKSGSMTSSLLPRMEICSDCHDVDDECEICHTAPDDAETYPVSGTTSGKDFSHQFHMKSFADCSDCHQEVYVDGREADRAIWPVWKCSACHQENRPEDHDLVWTDSHGLGLDPVTGDRCSVCHTEYYCDRCHIQSQFKQGIHDPNYLFNHSFEAQIEVIECTTCHEVDNDCRRCHEQQMVLPTDHGFINWTVIGSGGLHGEEALNNPERCQVCHAANSCLRCHGGNE